MSKKTVNQKLEILVVDDDSVVRKLHHKNLAISDIDHEITTFENGKEALEYMELKQDPQTSFLVLLDINMPVMDGWEFLEGYKESGTNETFVLMVTSSIDGSDKDKAHTFPNVIGFYEKPFKPDTVKGIKALKELKHFFKNTDSSILENQAKIRRFITAIE